jgi:hypothetical protein
MAVYRDRSMNAELLEGSVDGTYKRYIMNRSLFPDPDRRLERADKMNLNRGVNGFGVFEAGPDGSEKRTPDGRFCR